MTVTLPIHPLAGMALALVRLERDHQGRRYVIVEHPHGGQLRLPLDWTDRAAPASPPQVNGRDVRLAIRGLRALAAAVAVARSRKLDLSEVAPAPSSQAEEASPPSARAPVAWAALSAAVQRDLLGAWASLLRKTLRPRVEVPDERQDPPDPSRSARRRLSPAVGPQAGTRAS